MTRPPWSCSKGPRKARAVGPMARRGRSTARRIGKRISTRISLSPWSSVWGQAAISRLPMWSRMKSRYAEARFNSLERGDLAEAVNAAKQIGDDTLQRNAGRRPNPHTFTHGTSEQRQRWCAVALGMSASFALAQEVTLRCQHFLSPKASVPQFFMAPWAEKVMAESNGRIKVELYPAMQLGGKPPALYDQIRDGVIDCGWALPGYTPGRFPESEAFELPFMTTMNAEESSKAAWEYSEKYLMERMGDVHLIATHVHGAGVIHTKGKTVNTPSDFEQSQIRQLAR